MPTKPKINKVVLAYSGGLDTSVIVPWLKENYGCEVICFCANMGQGMNWPARRKSHRFRGQQILCRRLAQEFITDFVFPTLQSGAVYERKYLLGTSSPGRSSPSAGRDR